MQFFIIFNHCPDVSDLKDAQLQKDKEERLRIFREQQEEERLKKLKDLEQQFLQAKKLREQQEEERKRRIEEARIKETERRQQVEERKRQIWEAEQVCVFTIILLLLSLFKKKKIINHYVDSFYSHIFC